MPNIRDSLRDFNPWWRDAFTIEFKEREIYQKIQKYIPLPQIIAFTGIRRIGKTTLLFKIVEDAIKNGFNPQNIVYFSFDEYPSVDIKKIINEYEELMSKNIRKDKYLFLLDEVQKLANWEAQVKVIYDLFKNIKIFLSGSESLFVRKGARESLAGRLFEFQVEPLSFKEFLLFQEVNLAPIELYEKDLLGLFNDFILTMGFPELVGIKEKEIIKKYVRESIIEKVIYRDFQNLFKVREIATIESLLNIFMEDPGQVVQLSDLANDLHISRHTLSAYLTYLEESFLVRKLYNFSSNRRKIERKLKKYYPSLISVDLLFKEDNFSQSRVFEWLLINQLKPEFFWRDPYKNEVDMVLGKDKIVPVEIKFGRIKIKGMFTFLKKFKLTRGLIITPEKEDVQRVEGKIINIVPAYKFLLKPEKYLEG